MDFKNKELQEQIEALLYCDPKPPAIVVPRWWLERESAARPNDFIFRDDGTIIWCGYIVHTYGDRYESN